MKPLAERLFLKPDMAAAVINAPAGVADDLPATHGLKTPGKRRVALDWLLVFVADQAAVKRVAPTLLRAMKPDAVLWLAYPKLTGAIRTDINRDAGWDAIRALGLDTVAAVSIDDTWSALRFRPADKIGSKR
jgi:hypothetical protein